MFGLCFFAASAAKEEQLASANLTSFFLFVQPSYGRLRHQEQVCTINKLSSFVLADVSLGLPLSLDGRPTLRSSSCKVVLERLTRGRKSLIQRKSLILSCIPLCTGVQAVLPPSDNTISLATSNHCHDDHCIARAHFHQSASSNPTAAFATDPL